MPGTPNITIATHSGMFHADDVLAVAILASLFKNHTVVRTRDKDEIAAADFAVDVGGSYNHLLRRYDHHMPSPPRGQYGRAISSAGLIWHHYGLLYLRTIGIPKEYTKRLVTINLHERVLEAISWRWIRPIDRVDNGESNEVTPLSDLVSAMRPISVERSPERFDELFLETMTIVIKMFERACFHAADWEIARLDFEQSPKTTESLGRILISEVEVRTFGHHILSDVHFVLFPAMDNDHYIIRPILTEDRRSYKTPIPEQFLGLEQPAIEGLGVEGINFIHQTGFTARADSKEAAVAFCNLLLDQSTREHESLYYPGE